jgi:hypothetical protein
LARIRTVLSGSGGANGYGGQVQFFTKQDNSTSTNTSLVLDNAGNVGIGTTTPTTALDVAAGPLTLEKAYYENLGTLSVTCGSSTTLSNYNTNIFTVNLSSCSSNTTTANIPTWTNTSNTSAVWNVTFFVTGGTASVFNVNYNGASTSVYWDKNSTGGAGGASYSGFTVPSGHTDVITCAVMNNAGTVSVFCGVAAQY